MPDERRMLYWEGSSKKDFKEFPIPVQKGCAVRGSDRKHAALGKTVERPRRRDLRVGRGPSQRYIPAVYTVRIGEAVHVLHAFQKKSKSGIATPQPDVDLIEKRLKTVLARYGLSGRAR